MGATSVDIQSLRKIDTLTAVPCYASAVYYAGSLVCIATTDGYLRDGTDATARIFAGVCAEGKTASSTSGVETCLVHTNGIFKFVGSGFTQASIGKVVYLSDNQTVTTTATTYKIVVGTIVGYIDSTHVWVRVKGLDQMGGWFTSGQVGYTQVVGFKAFTTNQTSTTVTATPLTALLAASATYTNTVAMSAAASHPPLSITKTLGTSGAGVYQCHVVRTSGSASAAEFTYILIGTTA